MTDQWPESFREWPDDAQVMARSIYLRAMVGNGAAMCPHCDKAHWECGRQHLDRPWSLPPRCTDCGEFLRLPEHQSAA